MTSQHPGCECQPGSAQVCNRCLGITDVPPRHLAEACWCDLGIKDVCDVCQYPATR